MQIYSLTLQNFESYGNTPTTIKFNMDDRLMGIIGKNGQGKSSIMDGIMYGLYGTSFRKVRKNDLVNRINQKGLLVCIQFHSKGSMWTIKRTLKEVEIYKGDDPEPIELEAHMYDIQKFITNNIIGIDENIFRTVAMVAMRNFKSFFTLSKDKRRELFESIIDIEVLRDMRKMFNARLNDLCTQQASIEIKIGNIEKNLITGNNNLEKLTELNNTSIEKLDTEKNEYNDELRKKQEEKNKIEFKEEILKEKKTEVEQLISNLEYEKRDLKRELRKIEADIEFFSENDNCPRCRSNLSKKQKNEEIKSLNASKKEIEKRLERIEEENKEVNETYDIIHQQLLLHEQLNRDINNVKFKITSLIKQINEVNEVSNDNELKNDLNEYITKQKNDLIDVEDQFNNIKEFINIINTFKDILSDEGLKRFIYNQFLPILNKYINDILKEFEFNVKFVLEENLQETIYNKVGDEISINTFSAGEQQLIDMSFMFGLQKFLEKVNNFNAKICFIDELLDSSLDATNLEKIMNFMRSEERDKQIIIITHKTNIKEYFDCCYIVKKENEFSKIYTE